MVREPPPCGRRPGCAPRARTDSHASAPARRGREPGSALSPPATAPSRWRRGGDPRPSAHLKRSAAADWRTRRGPGEGRRPCHWPRSAPVTVLAATAPPLRREVLNSPACRAAMAGQGQRQGWRTQEAQARIPARPPAASERGGGHRHPRVPCGPRCTTESSSGARCPAAGRVT